MTGGSKLAAEINQNLAVAAEGKGWAIGLGSTRALLESDAHKESFLIRKQAPSVPLIANIGAVQFNYGYGAEHCQRIVDMTGADSIVLHLNSLQEVVQDGGDLNFKDLLPKIEEVCRAVNVPVGAKEVGFGIDGTVARKLYDAGVSYIDVAGAGGTSWSQVEKLRTEDPLRKAAAEAFNGWGIPTKDCIVSVKNALDNVPVVASGGMKTGLDAAKAITVGADIVGFARQLLKAATESADAVTRTMDQIEMELKMAMFGIGAKDLQALKNTDRVNIMGKSLMSENR
jgi:isopentenyl-diphosphate delta-isomerase